jgi:hypothetical protein
MAEFLAKELKTGSKQYFSAEKNCQENGRFGPKEAEIRQKKSLIVIYMGNSTGMQFFSVCQS